VRTLDGLEILIIKHHDLFYVIDNLCPHEDAALDSGCIREEEITCPLHHWRFNYITGHCKTHEDFDLPAYAVKIQSGSVSVEIPVEQES